MEKTIPQTIDFKKLRRGLVAVLIIGMAAAFIITASTFNAKTVDYLFTANTGLLILAIALTLLSYLFNALTLQVLANAVSKPEGLFVYFKIFLAGTFASYVTPFGSGGLPTQAYFLTKTRLTTSQALAVVTGRVLVSIWFFGFIAPISALFITGRGLNFSFLLPLITIIFLTAAFLYFLYLPSSFDRIISYIFLNYLTKRFFPAQRLAEVKRKALNGMLRFHDSLIIISKKKPLSLLIALIMESFAWVLYIIAAPVILAALGWFRELVPIFFRVLVLLAIIPFSPTPGGSGLAEGGLLAVTKGLAPASLVGPAILLWRFITFYMVLLIGGIIFSLLIKTPSALRER